MKKIQGGQGPIHIYICLPFIEKEDFIKDKQPNFLI